jgi:predicted metal-dependent hydrolase
MALKVVMLPGVGNVTFSQNRRSTRLRLSVRPDQKILVSFPPAVTFREAAGFVQKHKNWIHGQQLKISKKAEEKKIIFPIVTKFHTVNIQPGGEKFSVKQKKFEINIFFPSILDVDSPRIRDYVCSVLDAVYRWEARHYLPGRLAGLAAEHGFQPGRLSLRNNRSNWGSCSSGNRISLNIKLMKLPEHLIDFVLLHELVHTRIRNHGSGFKSMLDQLSGGKMKQFSAEIKGYSPMECP